MEYKSYQHIERLGTDEVEGILEGTVHVFTKIDGTACSAYLGNDDNVHVGGRRRELNEIDNNQGTYQWIVSQDNIKEYLNAHPSHILFAEFLIKNQIKNYSIGAWKKAYIFDVFDVDRLCYIPYEEYQSELEKYGILYIPLVAKLENPTVDDIIAIMDEAYFLQEEKGKSEGIVIKNYSYRNRYGRQTWAKIVREEYKHKKTLKKLPEENADVVEVKIVKTLLTEAMIEKEFLKLSADGWSSKMISQLLGTIWHEFITEEAWNIVKKYKCPTVDFKLLRQLVETKIKFVKKDLF